MARLSSEGKTLASPCVGPLLCGGCADDGCTNYCMDCTLYLCTRCDRIHRKGNLYKTHTILPITETTEIVNLVDDFRIQNSRGEMFSVSESKYADRDSVVLFSREESHDVRVFNTRTKSMKSFTCGTMIGALASLSTDRHVMIDYSVCPRKLHLLNESFQTLTSLPTYADDYQPYAVCSESATSFIMQEKIAEGPLKTRVSRVNIVNNKLNVDVLGSCDLDNPFIDLALHINRQTLWGFLAKSRVFKLHLQTMKYITLDFEEYDSEDMWFAMDDQHERILVINVNGRVTMFDESGEYKGMFHVHGGSIRGAALKGSSLVISLNKGNDNHIQVYNVGFK